MCGFLGGGFLGIGGIGGFGGLGLLGIGGGCLCGAGNVWGACSLCIVVITQH